MTESEVDQGQDNCGRFRFVQLDDVVNNCGISGRESCSSGGFNVWGNSYPAEEMPDDDAVISFGDVQFRFPAKRTGQPDNVVCIGQAVPVTVDEYCGLAVLGAAERRGAADFIMHCIDGSTFKVPLALSDWWPEAEASFDNELAIRCGCLHYPGHVQHNMSPAVWVYRTSFANSRLREIVLPDAPNLHIFALTVICARK